MSRRLAKLPAKTSTPAVERQAMPKYKVTYRILNSESSDVEVRTRIESDGELKMIWLTLHAWHHPAKILVLKVELMNEEDFS